MNLVRLQTIGLRISSALARFRKAEDGASALEFALLAPPFFLILGVIFETGLMLFTEISLQSSVQEASRLVRTGQVQSEALSEAQFKEKICDTAGIIIDCTSSVTVYVRADNNFATLADNLPDFLSVGSGVEMLQNADPDSQDALPQPPRCYNPGQSSQPAAIIATYDWTFSMMGMSFLGNVGDHSARRLVGVALFQNEPFPAGGAPAAC